jgi:hypothetical protein
MKLRDEGQVGKGGIWRLRDDAYKKFNFCEVERDVKENMFQGLFRQH